MNKIATLVLRFLLNHVTLNKDARNAEINKKVNEEIQKAKIYSLKDKDNPKFVMSAQDISRIVKISVEESDKLYMGEHKNGWFTIGL